MNVSVIIPVRNGEQTLDRAIQSAVGECHRVIIVDDASRDHSLTLAREFEQTFSCVEVIATGSSVRLGVCAARNIGITHAPGPLIIPLDADDWLEPGAVQKLVDAYEPDTFVYGGWHEWQGQNQRYRSPGAINNLNHKNVAQATFLFAKADWQAVGGYDADFSLCAEDYALMVSLCAAGLKGHTLDIPTYNYTVSEGGRAARCIDYFPVMKSVARTKWPGIYA